MSAAIPAIPEFLRPWLGSSTRAALIFYGVCAILFILLVLSWQRWGRGPRRRRAYRQAQRHLQEKSWRQALDALQVLKNTGKLSAMWAGRARNIEGEAMRLMAEAELAEGRFEDSMEHFRAAAALLNLDERQYRERVGAGMLAEVRRRFALGGKGDDILALIERTLKVQAEWGEALFWRALCQVRAGRVDQALASLHDSVAATPAHRQTGSKSQAPPRALDPILYLGALLLRQGQVQEALRHLSEANKLCPESPFVSLLLGSAIVAGGGDQMALRPLQRALGAQGFQGWNRMQQRAWVEGLPGPDGDKRAEGKALVSYVRRLASEHPFQCPVLGDVTALMRQGLFALAQAHYRLGHYQESADLYGKVLQEGAPTVPVLRGLGLSLARLEQYDQAFKHLRAAFEQEEPKTHVTAGYLALCGARGKPNKPEDKANNVGWAIRLLSRFTVQGDREWAGLVSGVFAEARAFNLPVAAEDQQRLCGVLASVEAVDAAAASAFEELHVAAPQMLHLEQAWLYCRAAQFHGAGSVRGLELFARTCADDSPARSFFAQRHWDFEDVEYAYLERLARWHDDLHTLRNGTPDKPSPLAGFVLRPAQELLLLKRSRRHADSNELDAAIAAVEVLHQLAPSQREALDRLAELHYRKGNLHRAAAYLADCHALDAHDPQPLVRRAVVEQQRGNERGCFRAIQQALELTTGTRRAAIAFLGARLALADYCRAPDRRPGHPSWNQAGEFLQTCLHDEPDHRQALWCLAALRILEGNRASLTALAPALRRVGSDDGLFHYLAAVSNLGAGAATEATVAARRAIDLSTRVAAEGEPIAGAVSPLELESSFVLGWALQQHGDSEAAIAPLKRMAGTTSLSADHARLLLGRIHFERGDFDNAVLWWNAVDAQKRAGWQLDRTLRDTVLLTGLLALRDGRFEQAGDRFREAARLGRREPLIDQLLILARVKAAQQLLYGDNSELLDTRPVENAAWLLKSVVQDGCQDPNVGYLLALAYKRQDNILESRNALRQITPPDAHIFLQLALLSLREARSGGSGAPLAQAEEELLQARQRCAQSAAPALAYAVALNLLRTHLSLGKTAPALALIPRLLELTAEPAEQRSYTLLQALLHSCQTENREERFLLMLTQMGGDDEEALLSLMRGLGHLDTVGTLLKILASVRPESAAVRQANIELTILQAKSLLDRGDAVSAERLLAGLYYDKAGLTRLPRPAQMALYNLLGCCACLCQDFDGGVKYFDKALNLNACDPRLQQNIALAHELHGRFDDAEPHWNRYIDLLDGRLPMSPIRPEENYYERLAFECLTRLAQRYTENENWPAALSCLQRARALRAEDADTLEKLFHLNNQLKRFEEARQVLEYLRHVRTDAPQLDLYELELIEIKNLEDIERLLAEIERVREKHPGDAVVTERSGSMVANVVGFLTSTGKQHREQLHKTTRSLNRLQSYQINWPEVHKFLRDMRSALLKMKRTIERCQPLTTSEQQRRQLQQLRDKIESDIELCRSLGA